MPTLMNFSAQEKELIVSLPYRTGIWMSHSDDEDGGTDDKREMKALQDLLKKIANSKKIPVFVTEIAKETLAGRDRWVVWQDNTMDVVPDCSRAMELLVAKCGKKDSVAYGRLLITVAHTVAGAHGEFGEDLYDDQKWSLKTFVLKLLGHSRKREDFMNISSSEQAALDRLSAALRISRD